MTTEHEYTEAVIETAIQRYAIYLEQINAQKLYDECNSIEKTLRELFCLDGLIARMRQEHYCSWFSIPSDLLEQRKSLMATLKQGSSRFESQEPRASSRLPSGDQLIRGLIFEQIEDRLKAEKSYSALYCNSVDAKREVMGTEWTASSHEELAAILWRNYAIADMECLFQLRLIISNNLEPVIRTIEQRSTTRQRKPGRVSEGGAFCDTGTQALLRTTVGLYRLPPKQLAEYLVTKGLDGGLAQAQAGTSTDRIEREAKRLREAWRVQRGRHKSAVSKVEERLRRRLANDGYILLTDVLKLADDNKFWGREMDGILKRLGVIMDKEAVDTGRLLGRTPHPVGKTLPG